MANKYLIHGAAFCGDGSSPALATTNGGVGAWNDLAFMEGTPLTYGTMVAGDTVFVRSKDASNADIVRTLTANRSLGAAAGSTSAFLTWVIDDGTVFPGFNGTITYTNASTFIVTFLPNNRFVASVEGSLVIRNTAATPSAGNRLADVYGHPVNVKFDWSAKTGTGQCYAFYGYNSTVVERPIIVWGPVGGAANETSRALIINPTIDSLLTIINPSITLNSATPGFAIFAGLNRNAIRVVGGDISGPGATSGQPLFMPGGTSSFFESIGLNFPRVMDIITPTYAAGASLAAQGFVSIIGCDNGLGGHTEAPWGFSTSRTDSNPPVLSSSVPDSAGTAWSWRVYPKTASLANPVRLTGSHLYLDTAGVRTITQEILAANSMTLTEDKTWMTVEYTDAATGLCKHLTTRLTTASVLPTSTASWSAAVWGAVTLVKNKLSITTPTAIKQNSLIHTTLWSTQPSANANDILFIDPDIGVN